MPKNKTTVLTVNGRNPATGGFIDPRWCRISSINSIMKVGSAQLTICVNCIDHVSSHKLRILDTKVSSFRRRKPPNVEMSEIWRLVAVPKLSGFPHLTWQFTPFHHPNLCTCVFVGLLTVRKPTIKNNITLAWSFHIPYSLTPECSTKNDGKKLHPGSDLLGQHKQMVLQKERCALPTGSDSPD